MAGVEARTIEFDGSDPLPFVVSKNLHRRHLTESQRAMVAAAIASMSQGERTDLEPSANLQKVSQPQAAVMLNVSTRTVASAVKVKNQGIPELVTMVESGEVSINAAAKVAELKPDDQGAGGPHPPG